MHGNVSASGKSVTGQTVTDADQTANEWFMSLARKLYPKDAGLSMHLLTGFEDRTCYRYAAGDRKVPGFFVYTVLRSEHGGQWLNAIMDASTTTWWADLQRDRGQAAAARAFVRGMESI